MTFKKGRVEIRVEDSRMDWNQVYCAIDSAIDCTAIAVDAVDCASFASPRIVFSWLNLRYQQHLVTSLQNTSLYRHPARNDFLKPASLN